MQNTATEHILVTGATGGIGLGICHALAERARRAGGPLRLSVASSKPGERLDQLVAELRAAGIEAHGVTGDVTDPADLVANLDVHPARGDRRVAERLRERVHLAGRCAGGDEQLLPLVARPGGEDLGDSRVERVHVLVS